LKIQVVVHPNTKSRRVEKDLLGNLHVYVNQPPIEGRANKVVVEMLAEYFGKRKSSVRIVGGERAKVKLIEIG